MEELSTLWETYFHHRASIRLNENFSSLSNNQKDTLFELFMGPNEKRFTDQEPCFLTLQAAFECANSDVAGTPWRVRDVATGVLIVDSESWHLSQKQAVDPK